MLFTERVPFHNRAFANTVRWKYWLFSSPAVTDCFPFKCAMTGFRAKALQKNTTLCHHKVALCSLFFLHFVLTLLALLCPDRLYEWLSLFFFLLGFTIRPASACTFAPFTHRCVHTRQLMNKTIHLCWTTKWFDVCLSYPGCIWSFL